MNESSLLIQDAITLKTRWRRQSGDFINGIFGLAVLPTQGIVVASCYNSKIFVLSLADGHMLGVANSESRHIAADPDRGRIYCPKSNAITVLEWDPHSMSLETVETLSFTDGVFEINANNSIIAFVPARAPRVAHLVLGKWGGHNLSVVNLDTSSISRAEKRESMGLTGLASDAAGSSLLYLNNICRKALVLDWPLPLA